MMDKLAKDVGLVLKQFKEEEVGNRLSQFSVIALQNMVGNLIKNYKPEVKVDKKKEK